MSKYHCRLLVLALLFTLVGCGGATMPSQPAEQPQTQFQYNQESWRQIIGDDCLTYFDGCNTCRRNPQNGLAACTRKACLAYKKPACLDDAPMQ